MRARRLGFGSAAPAVVLILALIAVGCGNDGGTDASLDESSPPTADTLSAPDPSQDAPGETEADGSQAAGGATTIVVGGTDAEADGASAEAAEDASAEAADGPATSVTVPSNAVTPSDVETLAGPELEEFLARRYEAFWQLFAQAREAPSANPTVDYAALAELAAGEQLDQANDELVGLAANGEALRRPDEPAVPGLDSNTAHRVRVERADESTAELVVCFINDRISYRVEDGAVINDLVVTVKAEATMARTDGTWKLIRSRAVALDPGVAGCWLESESVYPW